MRKTIATILCLAAAGHARAQAVDTLGATTSPATSAPSNDEIVVTATRSGDQIPISLVGSSVTVIDDQQIQARQTRVLSDVLRDVPGVAVSRLGAVGGQTQVRIRGAEGNHTLVFIDGIKADDPYNGEYDFGTLLNDEASRVEVLRGQQSSLYGSDAIGGVISYTTLSGREKPGYTARAEGGSMGTFSGGARAAGVAGDRFDYALTGSYLRTDGYPTAPGGDRDIGSRSLGTGAKLGWVPADNLKITGVGRYSRTKADMDEFGLASDPPRVDGVPVLSVIDQPGFRYRNRAWSGLVGANWTLFDGAWTNAASGAIADTDRDAVGGLYGPSGDDGRRYRTTFDSTIRFGDDHLRNRFTLAMDYERQSFRNTTPSSFADQSRHVLRTYGYVANYDLTVDNRLTLGASARIDDFNLFADAATYRATGSYLFTTGTRVHAAYGTGIKAPVSIELFGYSDGLYVGNPDLKPEKSKGWEAGIEQSFASKAATIGATYFRNRLVDQIVGAGSSNPVTGAFVRRSVNLAGQTRQQGVEVYANARYADIRLDAAYTYLKAPQTINAFADPTALLSEPIRTQAVRRAKNIASVNLTYAPASLPVTATVTVRYNGRQRDYAFTEFYNTLLVDLRSYTLVNLNATWDVTKNVQVYGRVENLLDRNYQEVFAYETPGRAAYGGVRLSF